MPAFYQPPEYRQQLHALELGVQCEYMARSQAAGAGEHALVHVLGGNAVPADQLIERGQRGRQLRAAAAYRRLRAIAPFYGTNPRPLEAVRRMCPVVGGYPGKDFTARSGRKLDRRLAQLGVARDIKVYAGTRHSFFNDAGRTYNTAAAEDAWRRTLEFFAEHVQSPRPSR